MESTVIYATLLYLIGFRLLIVLLGGMSIFLGYRLFTQAMGGKSREKTDMQGSDMEARFGENRLTLKNAAPGTFFAAFGAAMVIIVLAGSPPAFTFKTRDMSLASESGHVRLAQDSAKSASSRPEAKSATSKPEAGADAPRAERPAATEITLRAEEVPETAQAAHALAVKHFRRLLKLEEHAVALDRQNAEYQDSLAGLYFVAGKLDKALEHQEQAGQLAPQREDIQQRLAVYRQLRPANE